LNCRKKRRAVLGISGGNTAPTLQMQKGVFHQMPEAIQISIVRARVFTVFLWRNHCFHPHSLRFLDDCIAVVAPVGKGFSFPLLPPFGRGFFGDGRLDRKQ
jgi:hypothetical protein